MLLVLLDTLGQILLWVLNVLWYLLKSYVFFTSICIGFTLFYYFMKIVQFIIARALNVLSQWWIWLLALWWMWWRRPMVLEWWQGWRWWRRMMTMMDTDQANGVGWDDADDDYDDEDCDSGTWWIDIR